MNYILRNTDRMFRSSSDSESDTGPITYVSVGNLFNLPELLFPPLERRENGTVKFMACRGGKLLSSTHLGFIGWGPLN